MKVTFATSFFFVPCPVIFNARVVVSPAGVPADPGCDRRVSVGHPLDPDPGAAPPPLLPLPAPLLPAHLQEHQAPGVHQ